MKSSPDLPPETKPLRIFVVEHRETTAKYLSLFLETRGHHVVCVNTMGEALERLPQAECDVLLCDVLLPDGNGWDLPLLVNQSFPRPTIAVAMSPDTRTENRVEVEAAGFLHRLDKPIDPEALEAVLDQAAWMLDGLAQERATHPDRRH